MNRSVLLVICDFLLLSLLALAKFDAPEPEEPEEIVAQAQQEEVSEDDLIEVLRMSLEAEQAASDELARQLAKKEKEIDERSDLLSSKDEKLAVTMQSLQSLEDEQAKLKQQQEALSRAREQLEQDKTLALADKQRILEEKQRIEAKNEALSTQTQQAQERLNAVEQERLAMTKQVGKLKEQSASSQERLKFLQQELQEKQAAVAAFASTQERLEHEKRLAEIEKQALATKLEVATTETQVIKQQLVTARADIEASRQNVEQMQQHATQLAAGVTTLAESTDQIREEVKQMQPQSLNLIFDRYKKHRVELEFTATRQNLFGESEKQYNLSTILVTDSTNAFVFMHIADTPLQRGKLSAIGLRLYIGNQTYRIADVAFLSADPRILMIILPLSIVEQEGVEPFAIAREPLRFPEAVLIDSQENYYGESEFKLLPDSDRYMRMQSTVFSRLFGEFSPKRGDIVFAKTGEFMGMMVNKNYGVLVSSANYSAILPLGDGFTSEGNAILAQQRDLIDALEY